jgi:hypothetical protein
MKTFRSRSGAIGALWGIMLSLSACLQTAPPPADPYLGLMPAGRQVTQAAQGFPIVGTAKSVAVVLSSSSDKQMAFVADFVKQLKNNPLYTYRADFDEVLQPQFVLTSIVSKFKERFARVESVGDFRGVKNVDYVALIDFAVQFPREFNYYYQYDIRVDILTPTFERIGTLTGHGRQTYSCIPIDCALAAQLRAMKMAVGQFDAAFDAAIR